MALPYGQLTTKPVLQGGLQMEYSWILDKAKLNHGDEQGSFETFVLRDFSKHILAHQTVKEKGFPRQKYF